MWVQGRGCSEQYAELDSPEILFTQESCTSVFPNRIS